ncbi:MAG: PSD1 domain-containing protein [Verrucomicrobia bacterium]|nr:PSD1 domain-containing protein [Verrucomicrobiota bacterium]
MQRAARILAVSLGLWGVSIFAAPAPVPADHGERMTAGLELFQKSVGALLKENCLECHGASVKLKGDLDLATRESLLKGGAHGPVVVPFNAAESKLVQAIKHSGELQMPNKKPKLPADAIAQIAKWVDLGAPYAEPLVKGAVAKKDRSTVTEQDRQFWSFQPLKKTSPPAVKNKTWEQTPVDRFVLAGLEAKRLKPNAAADARTLVRRIYFDLIGLPPTPEEVEAFVKSAASNRQSAIETLVEKLLASEHYGERWGRHWLDLARFAESHGFEQDYDRPHAYHYRDFVIKALNADMPYDQFVRWQLAGDELAPDNPLALMATGFLGAGVFPTQLTEKEFESARYDELDDMVATTGTALLGMSVGCARCHDHKFDPIPSKDYYRLVATFATTIRSEIDVDLNPAAHRAALAKWDAEHAPLAGALLKFEREELPGRFAKWAASAPAVPEFDWLVLDGVAAKAKEEGVTFTRKDDGSLLVTGANPDQDSWTFTAPAVSGSITAVRLEALADASLKKKGPGRADNGNFSLSDFLVTAKSADGKGKAAPVKLVRPRATFEQNQTSLSVASSIDTNKTSGWAVDPQFGRNHAAVFEFERPVSFSNGTVLTFELEFSNNAKHTIGRPRLSVTTNAGGAEFAAASQLQSVVEPLVALRDAGSADKLTPKQRALVLASFKRTDADWRALNERVEKHLAAKPKPDTVLVQVSSEGFKPIKHHADGRGYPHFYPQTYVLKRGDSNQKQDPATQGFMQVLMRNHRDEQAWLATPPAGARTSSRRTGLANWITDTESGAGHLLARVIVNRLWQHHFGRGIVGTPSDFGFQGEKPANPELLDFLAGELIRNGWSLKAMHKLMLLSAAYQQESKFDPTKAKADPQNTLVWRHTPQRLEGEVIRDSLLAVGGLLDPTMFGKGTLDENSRRRSIYFMIKRSKLIPTMQLFDAPEPLVSQGARPATVIAPQALMFMNSAAARQAAANLAKRLSESAPTSAALVERGYQLTLGRAPTEKERTSAVKFIERQAASYGDAPDARTRAATDFCQVLFGLNEFVYIQ